jgi:hypothetical protein
MNKFFIQLICLLAASWSSAQALFIGKVSEDSAGRSPLFQAEVFILANGVDEVKMSSNFDGTFAFKTAKNSFYSVKVQYPGCKAVSVEFQTDKKGVPSLTTALFVMIKDGLRLVGKVLDMKTKMPIERADVILKDIQTREETRFTTGKDGAYNLKLRYETNYRVRIDKRSPGILNRYEDTVFYVSTIGFNMPLDYTLDIYLRPVQTLTYRSEYEYHPVANSPATKPVIEVEPTLNADGTPRSRTSSPMMKESPKNLKTNPSNASQANSNPQQQDQQKQNKKNKSSKTLPSLTAGNNSAPKTESSENTPSPTAASKKKNKPQKKQPKK